MCGIAGVVSRDTIDPGLLDAMSLTLRHRGPDDCGRIVTQRTPQSRYQAGLVHRRLSIIDLSAAGRQPMSNEDNSVVCTYNGEVYNYLELRNQLTAHGHRFRSNTDTEVIVHGYEEWGVEVFSRLNGMFALAVWDSREEKLVLARDRYGQKPLYYWEQPDGIVFASELKALRAHPVFPGAIDLRALSRYLTYEYVPAPHTIFRGVRKCMPGSFVTFQRGVCSTQTYWQIRFDSRNSCPATSEHELENRLIELFRASVRRRLMSDVPLGIFLSGGIDSSAVVALLAQSVDLSRLKTFSIAFGEKSFDESPYARLVARHFGTDHYERRFTAQDMRHTLHEVWEFLDEPFADASILPTYMLSKFTRETVTVALGGDGGDELFAGYDPFVAHRMANIYGHIPEWLHNAVVRSVGRLPVSPNNMSIDFRLKQFLKGARLPLEKRNQTWLGAFSFSDQSSILSPEVLAELSDDDVYDDMQRECSNVHFRDWVDKAIYLYSRFYLAEDILTKVDRASMAVSLEVRTPFLDVELAEFVNALPSRLKLRGLSRKYLLKKSLAAHLPRVVLHRPKKGFGIPLTLWLRREMQPDLRRVFEPGRLRREGLFNPAAVKRLLHDHFVGKKDNRKQIWTLLMFEQWRERYGG